MKVPRGLEVLIDDGIVDAVVAQLKSGKEASVFIVACGSERRCAKVYKDAEHRGFHRLAQYQEGRKARGSREARAQGKHSQHGRRVQESAWQSAEVAALRRLEAAGVRVPRPIGVYEGVLLMELLVDADGYPAPRLNDVAFGAEQAREWHGFMIGEIVKMLRAGIIHGDLSEYNVLVDVRGPVIIDLPQAVDAASNNNAFSMLQRDIDNMRATFGRAAPELLETQYAREIWQLYQANALTADALLTGQFAETAAEADVGAVLDQIEEARREAEARERGRLAAEAD